MEALAQRLAAIAADLSAAVADALSSGVLAAAPDDGVLGVLAEAAQLSRLTDGLLVEATGQVHARSVGIDRGDRLCTRYGCRDANELTRRATRMGARRVSELQHAASGVRRSVSVTSGEQLPARFPAMRAALSRGDVSGEALAGAFRALDDALSAATAAQRLAADTELAASASGTAPDGQPPADADQLRMQAQVWAMVLDPDGAQPREERALRRREVRLGRCHDGVVPLRGVLLPDVAGQLQRLLDAIDNPKAHGPRFVGTCNCGGHGADADSTDGTTSGGDGASCPCAHRAAVCGSGCSGADCTCECGDMPEPPDERTAAQRRHDAFAAVLAAAAGAAATPSLNGAPPTLTVTVRADDLRRDRGYAHIDGVVEPVSLSVARHVACCGRVEQVTCDCFGRVLALRVDDRTFNAAQRRAIAARDGGCVIPGCGVPASWCEVHHVTPWAQGGKTEVDNGVDLCWFHHRTLDTSGWEVRMTRGVPEIRGPGWWDAARRWRPAHKHPAWMRPGRRPVLTT